MVAKRRRAHVRAATIAEALGISRGYLCDLEHGRRAWSPTMQRRYDAAVDRFAKKIVDI